jgi:DNA-directed RNA polymerase specialized sigma24 family protein
MRDPSAAAAASLRTDRPASTPPDAGSRDPHAELMRDLSDVERVKRMLAVLRSRARTRHGIAGADAEDIFQDSVLTYLHVHGKYSGVESHAALLFGIFHKKSLMFLTGVAKRSRQSGRLAERLLADRPAVARGEDPCGTTLDGLVRKETCSLIRRVVESMAQDRRELLLALAERRASRRELMAAMGLNPNTFDSRLHAARLRLRSRLRTAGVA